MDELLAWLRKRIDQAWTGADTRQARVVPSSNGGSRVVTRHHVNRADVVARCDAHSLLLEEYERAVADVATRKVTLPLWPVQAQRHAEQCLVWVEGYLACLERQVRQAGLFYAEHPGYRVEWAPGPLVTNPRSASTTS
jgi:hypothetical protein